MRDAEALLTIALKRETSVTRPLARVQSGRGPYVEIGENAKILVVPGM